MSKCLSTVLDSVAPDDCAEQTGEERRWLQAAHGGRGDSAGLSPIPGVTVGRFVGLDSRDRPLVDYVANPLPRPMIARTIIPLRPEEIGREAVLVFEEGDPGKPILMGLVQPERTVENRPVSTESLDDQIPPTAQSGGERLIFTAEKEIVLRCGEASITLTREGKVLIRGAYLLSRSSGTNRIKGASVQIN